MTDLLLPIVVRLLNYEGKHSGPGLIVQSSVHLISIDQDSHGFTDIDVNKLYNLADNDLEQCKTNSDILLPTGFMLDSRKFYKIVYVSLADDHKKYLEVTDDSVNDIIQLILEHGILKHRLEVHYLVKSEFKGKRRSLNLFGGNNSL